MFCHVASEQVFGVHDLSSVYHVPLLLQSQGIVEFLTKRLKLDEVKVSKEMREGGEVLGKRWRELTTGYVGVSFFWCFSFCLFCSI
jgi:CTP synthase